MALHDIELEWIHRLQNILRSSLLDYFFIGWNYVDTFPFLIILVAIVWFIINKRIGICLLYVFILSSIINILLKNCFNLPRPCQIDPMVGVMHFSSPGFPSGAAQTAMILAGIIHTECKKKTYQYLGLLFAFLLCFSRVYLGVHYFSDILGGLVVGGLLLIVYWQLSPLIEQDKKIVLLLFPILFLLIGPSKFLIQCGLSMGVAAGLFIAKKENSETKIWYFCYLEALIAILGVLILFEVKNFYPDWKFFFAFAGGFWFSHFGSFLMKKSISYFFPSPKVI